MSLNPNYPLGYINDTLFQYFPNENFASLRTNFVIFHNYFPDQSYNIPSQLGSINSYVNQQWQQLEPQNPSPPVFNIQYEQDISPENMNIRGQLIQSYNLVPGISTLSVDDQLGVNKHLCHTLGILFSMCPNAYVFIFQTSCILPRDNSSAVNIFYNKLFDQLHKPLWLSNGFVFFSNIVLFTLQVPTPDLQYLLESKINIPLFWAVGNNGWSINNFEYYYYKFYIWTWFTSNYNCTVGNYKDRRSSCGFLDPNQLDIPSPTTLLDKMAIFFATCRYAIRQSTDDFLLPTYQFDYNTKLPDNYQNQFRVPDVCENGIFLTYDGFEKSGTSFSVIVFSAGYQIMKTIADVSGTSSFIISSAEGQGSFISQMYRFQYEGKKLFKYQYQTGIGENQCQIILFPPSTYQLDPSGINCWGYPEYIVVEDVSGENSIGLNVMGLGQPIWQNWKISTS